MYSLVVGECCLPVNRTGVQRFDEATQNPHAYLQKDTRQMRVSTVTTLNPFSDNHSE